MGPQFVKITTSVESREGTTVQTFERRVLTFRSHGDPNHDHLMFVQYRTAYGAYATIRPEEIEQVRVQVDSLPDWAIIKVRVEPDYSIRVGAYDPTNSFTRYFRVKGPTIETGFTLGVPKVLYDTRAKDTVAYGSTSAMVRFYYVDEVSGHRFPVSFGIGTFGVSSPIDVDVGKGGFAVSAFLDVVEIMRALKIDLGEKVNGGLELTPFFPIEKKSRLLVDAHVSLSLQGIDQQVMQRADAMMIGQRISHFHILEKLGEGDMGVLATYLIYQQFVKEKFTCLLTNTSARIAARSS